jgi:hypothetical protein
MTPLETITAGFDADLLDLAKSFKQNLTSLMQTASLPFRMAIASVSTRYEIAEAILESIYTNKGDPSFGAKVGARIEARLQAKDEVYEFMSKVLNELEDARHVESFRTSSAELLLQAVVLIWSTFEVLVSDVFVLLLNRRPKLATELMRDERTKKWFQPKELAAMLPDYNYDFSNRMGEILIGWHRLDDIRAIRCVFEVLFPSALSLQASLQDKALWLLNQRRNLIVHRRAVVDRAYIGNTGDSIKIGKRLSIAPDYLESSLRLVRDTGSQILGATT